MNAIKCVKALTLVGAVCLFGGPAADAQAWSESAFDPLRIDELPESAYDLQMVPDGSGGVIVLWRQYADGSDVTYDVWAQRIDSAGQLVWPARVQAIATSGSIGATRVSACPDGSGGAAVAVETYDTLTGYRRVLGQRIAGDGTVMWSSGGVAAVSSPTGFSMQAPRIAAGGDGGFIVIWRDERNYGTTGYDIWAQRFSSTGGRSWGSAGIPVCNATGTQNDATLIGDGTGGAFIAWEDFRNGTSYSIYGQHLLASGTNDPDWNTTGSYLFGTVAGSYDPRLVAGGPYGGFLLGNLSDTSTQIQVVVARYNASGDYIWSSYASGDAGDTRYDIAMQPDDQGGAFVTWTDGRDDGWDGTDVYAQWVTPAGGRRWGDTGLAVGPANSTQSYPAVAPDGEGGAIVLWYDTRNAARDFFAQRISSSGSKQWNYYGVPFAETSGYVYGLTMCADGRGGVIGGWNGAPAGIQNDAFAQRIGPHGYIGDAAPRLTGVVDLPSDQGGFVRVDWDASYLDAPDPDIVDDYLVWRRAGGAKRAAPARESADREAEAIAVATGLAADDVLGQLDAGWSYVGSVTAYQFDAYSYEAATYADSTGAGEAPTEFKVLARDGSSVYWESNILAGHSLDNVSPGAPLALMAALSGPDGILDWSPAGVDDEDLQVYEVHRSAASGFVPGAATLLGTTADTTFVDADLAGGPWYYVVAGRDIHGNVGDPSNEVSLLTASAVGDEIPAAFTVAGASPNPFNPRTDIRFSLPGEALASVDVYDARGRWIARLHEGVLGRGWHTVAWDGRDHGGRAVPSGVYLAQVRAGEHRDTAKLVLAK